jgi:hypothetical protein
MAEEAIDNYQRDTVDSIKVIITTNKNSANDIPFENIALTNKNMEAQELDTTEETLDTAEELDTEEQLLQVKHQLEAIVNSSPNDKTLAKFQPLINEIKSSIESLTLRLPDKAPIKYKEWRKLPGNEVGKRNALDALKEIYSPYIEAGLLKQFDLKGAKGNNLDSDLLIAVRTHCQNKNIPVQPYFQAPKK